MNGLFKSFGLSSVLVLLFMLYCYLDDCCDSKDMLFLGFHAVTWAVLYVGAEVKGLKEKNANSKNDKD